MQPVLSKSDMYRRLADGKFGNTISQWLDIEDWAMECDVRISHWGVRTMTPGGPCRLNCPTEDVYKTFAAYKRAGHVPQISMMIDKISRVNAWLEVWDSPTGLVVEGIEHPDTETGWTWRNSMPDLTRRKAWHGVTARMILKKHCNQNSLEDLELLLTNYPDHVIEFSAVDRCLGTVPHRNCVVWEVRKY